MKITEINGTIALPKTAASAKVDLSAKVDGRKGRVEGTIADLQVLLGQTPTMINGSITVADATIGLNGIAQLTDALPVIDADFTANIPNPSTTAQGFAISLPPQAGALKSVTANGKLRMNEAGLTANASSSATYDGKNADIKLAVTSSGDWMKTPELEGDVSVAINGIGTLSYNVRLFQGAMAGKINVRGGNTVAFDTNVRTNGVQLDPLLGQLLDMDRLAGSGNMTLALKGRGQSLDQIMTSLSGNGTVKFTDGLIKGINLAAMMRNLKSAFGGFGSATEFSSLDGTFKMELGVLQNVDLSLLSPLFKASGKGSVDIGGQAMNYVVTPTRLSDDAEFSVSVTITGPWQNLKFRPDLDKLLNLLLDKELQDREEAKKIKKKLDDAKAKLKKPEDEINRKLQEEISRKTNAEPTKQKSFEDQAKEKIENEIGNALKKLFD